MQGKAENIKKAIEGGASEDVPASLVKPVKGDTHWFMDADAASMLTTYEVKPPAQAYDMRAARGAADNATGGGFW